MKANFKCKYIASDGDGNEENIIKKCSEVRIEKVSLQEQDKGGVGVIFYVTAKLSSSKTTTMLLKKISKKVPGRRATAHFVRDMNDEVKYSYKMAKHRIGPWVYDAFFNKDGDVINQYILMEKFENSVANWLLGGSGPKLNKYNCTEIADDMLDLLHKQIFTLDTYCSDIKVDNFVVNTRPLEVRMIDFGIEWCSSSRLPGAYSTVRSLKGRSTTTKKEVFYCLCMLQLFVNIVYIKVPLDTTTMFLWPFYKDDLFTDYILGDRVDIRKVLKEILDYGRDHAITLGHYLRKDKDQSNGEIVKYTFDLVGKISDLIFRPR